MTDHEIVNYGEMLREEDQLQEIGSEILKRAIRESTAERLGLPPENASVTRTVREGQEVPIDLKGKVDLTEDGLASSEWTDSWTDLGIWQRGWSDSGSETTYPELGELDTTRITPLQRFQIQSRLSAEEREILDELGMLKDPRRG